MYVNIYFLQVFSYKFLFLDYGAVRLIFRERKNIVYVDSTLLCLSVTTEY
jgi:hypothetical protein